MSNRQLAEALRTRLRHDVHGERALTTPSPGARRSLAAKKKEAARKRAAGGTQAASGKRNAKAAKAFVRAVEGYARSITDGVETEALSTPRSKSAFGDLVSRLIARRASASGAPRAHVAAAVAAAKAATPSPTAPPTTGTMLAAAALPVGAVLDPVLVLLVNRVTGAFLESEYLLARSLGPAGYLTHHFSLAPVDDVELNAFFAAVPNIIANPLAPMSPTLPEVWNGVLNGTAIELLQLEIDALPTIPSNGVVFTDLLQGTTIARAILSRRRLLERMTEFWTDHFNIDLFTPFQGWLKPVDDREVIRENALGSFHTMVDKSMHSPAMLSYLDQFLSSSPDPNENYARELLELHTVGEGQGYTEEDIRDVADLLSGWSIGFGDLKFDFKPDQHVEAPDGGYSILKDDPNPIPIPKDPPTSITEGQQEGEDLLTGLQTHPNTAKYIATKMLRFMLRYEPTSQQIIDVARAYTTNSGSSEAMIREILKVANLNSLLATSPTTLKVKRPFQLATTFLRSVGGVPQWSTTQGAAVSAGGAGYAVGDELTVVGGVLEPGGSPAVFQVLDIDAGAGGAVTVAGLLTEGDYQTLPTNPASTTTTGSGSGCTLDVFPTAVNPFAGFIERLQILSNAPFEWGPPDGYPDAEQAWIGNLLGRWELLADLVRNEVPGIFVDQDALVNLIASVPGNQVGEYLNTVMAGGALSSEEETLVQAYFNLIVVLATQPPGGPTPLAPEEIGTAVAELFAVVGTAPSYQYY